MLSGHIRYGWQGIDTSECKLLVPSSYEGHAFAMLGEIATGSIANGIQDHFDLHLPIDSEENPVTCLRERD